MVWALGLMSGTSLDGVDAALIETDGVRIGRAGPSLTLPYSPELRAKTRALLDRAVGLAEDDPNVLAIARDLTLQHVEVVRLLREQAPDLEPAAIGFHGQTILHQPERGRSWQIGEAGLLQDLCGVPVISDFRSRDLENGGEGAPLVPVFHAALLQQEKRSVAVLNIGGVANVTVLGPQDECGQRGVWACDTGPGNALLDDWVLCHTGQPCDFGGALALSGAVHADILERLLAIPYFARPMPKSLDRLSFHPEAMACVRGLSVEDGAATLAAFTIESVVRTVYPVRPEMWFVAGGGRHNPVLMNGLKRRLGAVASVDVLGWDGDALEAQCFGLLAVRCLHGLPSSWPGTTGVRQPCIAGRAV
ncbi:anhydro-N-acetylmuramic acid kinase [Gluconobacter kanchanaburiensis]|uniref:Anhydro-N-acetylmuramic acid kinase n=1 Tax=Gluconobacter kanchanaburiensis NBRC 103587 TaxID=1307948 RepID=A0A511B7S3_9PROT|nr:anhydro-N-acetylmuramic acid kinase [Gluconobacter kanchanaburiensis]MBF0862226.1 anhydro-N-acetylmuramic acid kinase [Gluconobacter kanchanaburiensis]GBR71430.1 anhydro-N-acetylmuramic acid kinase [Gluconobacter kanchanaburiensis NBRC 103587]GEK96505.1 anhydro-N-acetylmuramic acid kinase [Gluconobacter kanchanaburiensis NBRC 103587]